MPAQGLNLQVAESSKQEAEVNTCARNDDMLRMRKQAHAGTRESQAVMGGGKEME